MVTIFGYKDSDGDELAVQESFSYPGSVLFHADRNDARQSVRLDRDAVLRLHAALGEWLYPVHTPEWANKSLIEQMIERAVRDQVAAVLPLHLKPVATVRCDGTACCSSHPMDPEPRDVGHAEEPAAPYTPPVHMTTEDKCQVHACGSRHLASEPETDHGRLMSELPVRTRPRPICVSCGHGWGEHTSGICWGTSQTPEGAGCTCTRERPDSPASNPWDCKLCGHPNSVHVPATGECLECACRPGGGE